MTAEKRKFWWNIWCISMTFLFFLYVWLFGYQTHIGTSVGITVFFYAIIFGVDRIFNPKRSSTPSVFVKIAKVAFIFFSSCTMLGFWMAVVPKDLQEPVVWVFVVFLFIVGNKLVSMIHDYLGIKND